MKRVNLVLILLILSTYLFSQGCLPEGITFTTQEQIDNFQNDYPGCTEIIGNVIIEGEDSISNLEGLEVLTVVESTLIIRNNTSLTSLSGLKLSLLFSSFLIFIE